MSLCVRFCCENIFKDVHTTFFLRAYGKLFCHTVDVTLTTENSRNGLCVMPSCHTHVSHDADFAIHACHAMISLQYTRIARYRYAATTDDTEGGRAALLPVLFLWNKQIMNRTNQSV